MREQERARLVAERRDVERGARGKGRQCADRVQAPDEAAHPLERGRVVQFGRAAAAFRIDGEAEAVEAVQRPSVVDKRRDGGNLALGEFRDESVLLEDLRVGPA